MAAATPTVEQVITAIETAMNAISPSIGTVYTSFHTREDDVDFIRINGLISSGSMNAWFIDLVNVEEAEGPAAGEIYEFYQIAIVYWSLRTNNADWSEEARIKAESVRTALSGLAAVFAISSQRQMNTPETVRLLSHGPKEIRGTEGQQMVYETVLGLTAEGRRWS